MRFILFLLILIPNLLFSLELNLICTNKSLSTNKIDVKDIILILDSDKKKIELGGLVFFPKDLSITDSNISWVAEDVQLYPDSNGSISGIVGRFSGELILNFERYDDRKTSMISFDCSKFVLNKRKF